MKNFFLVPVAFSLMTFLAAASSFGSVQVTANCGSVNERSLAVAKMMDDPIQVGYSYDDEFFPMQVRGCEDIHLDGNRLLCDGAAVGTLGTFGVFGGEEGYSTPGAALTINSAAHVVISGACVKKQDRLTIEIQK